MNWSKILLAPLFLLGICSCSSDEVQIKETASQAHDVGMEARISSFLGEMKGTRANESVTIKSVNRTEYSIVDGVATRKELTRATVADGFTLSTVLFSADDKEGYAIMTEDCASEDIYYLTEEGSLSDIEEIAPLKEYVESIPQLAADEMNGVVSTVTPVEARNVAPFVKFKWGQGYPFNLGAPVCSGPYCSNETMKGHKYAGCLPLAVAQMMATTKRINPYSGIDLNNLPLANADVKESQVDNIYRFMKSVGDGCVREYGCQDTNTGTSGYFDRAYSYLLGHQYQLQHIPGKALDEELMYNELKLGIPHIIGGIDNSKGVGHAWLIDGLQDAAGGTRYHCIWGWYGESDGWVKGNYYTPTGRDEVYGTQFENLYILRLPWYLIY